MLKRTIPALKDQLEIRQQIFAALATVLVIVEYCIAYYLSTGFIRTVLNDVFIAMLVYSVVRAFSSWSPIRLGVSVWIFTLLVEVSQLFQLTEHLGLPRTQETLMVFGNTFDWRDVLAYTVGIFIVVAIDRSMCLKKVENSKI